jgi:hypothetical protein
MIAELFHSHLDRLRIHSESNSKSRLKTTETHVIVRNGNLADSECNKFAIFAGRKQYDK